MHSINQLFTRVYELYKLYCSHLNKHDKLLPPHMKDAITDTASSSQATAGSVNDEYPCVDNRVSRVNNNNIAISPETKCFLNRTIQRMDQNRENPRTALVGRVELKIDGTLEQQAVINFRKTLQPYYDEFLKLSQQEGRHEVGDFESAVDYTILLLPEFVHRSSCSSETRIIREDAQTSSLGKKEWEQLITTLRCKYCQDVLSFPVLCTSCGESICGGCRVNAKKCPFCHVLENHVYDLQLDRLIIEEVKNAADCPMKRKWNHRRIFPTPEECDQHAPILFVYILSRMIYRTDK